MRRPALRRTAIVVALAYVLAGCGSKLPPPSRSRLPPDLPNIAQIQTAIAHSVLTRDRINVTVRCPAIVPEITGETFSCIAFSRGRAPRAMTFLVREVGYTYVTFRQTS